MKEGQKSTTSLDQMRINFFREGNEKMPELDIITKKS